MRRFWSVVSIVTIAGCCGCHGSCRHKPGPAYIERRPVQTWIQTAPRPVEPKDDVEPLTAFKRTHPALGSIRGQGSFSIGRSTDGFVFNARMLPLVGQAHRVMSEQAGRATNFGTDELVEALMKAGADVAKKFPGSTLPVGNLSRGGGGPLKWSVSHKSGRDADIGFYLTDAGGDPVLQSSMTRVGRDGRTTLPDGSQARFDVQRNWALIKSLVGNHKISVQWIFIADHLKKRILDHARSRHEPAALIVRADEAMAQPRGLCHDDHIHLRLYCANDDLLEGCRDSGSNRPWYQPPGPRLARRYAELVRLAKSDVAATRRDAVEVLGHMGDRRFVRLLADRLSDCDLSVRRAAVEALSRIGIQGVESRVAAAILDASNPDDVADRLMTVVERSVPAASRQKVFKDLAGASRVLTVDNGVFVSVTDVARRASTGQLSLR